MIRSSITAFFRCIMIATCGFFILHNAYAQTNSVELPLKIGAGRLFTPEGRVIQFRQAQFDSLNASYHKVGSAAPVVMPMDKVFRAEASTGSKAGQWALICGGLGLAMGLVYPVPNDYGTGTIDDGDYHLIMGVTGLATGAIIGAIYGAKQKTYRTVYEDHIFITTPVPVRKIENAETPAKPEETPKKQENNSLSE